MFEQSISRRQSRVGSPLVFSLIFVVAFAASLAAQDDPFAPPSDQPGGLPGFDAPLPGLDNPTGAPPKRNADGTEPNPDTVLSAQLKERARRGNLSTADSIAALARVGRWEDVDVLLNEAAGKNLNDAVLALMGDRIDPSVMLRIRMNPELSDGARSLIDRISIATKNANESPARIRGAIKQLGSDSRDAKLAAIRTLKSGGRTSVAELTHAAIADEPPADVDDLLSALASFGPGGYEALQQLSLYGSPNVRPRATTALARMAGRSSMLELTTALHAADSSDDERNSAARHLATLGLVSPGGQFPQLDATLQTLRNDLKQKRDVANTYFNDEQISTFWSVNPDRDGVVFQDAPTILKPYRDAADAAARLRRLGIRSPDVQNDALTSDVAYRVMVDSDWGDESQIKEIREAYPSMFSIHGFIDAIGHAINQNDVPAAVGLIRMTPVLANSADEGALADELAMLVRAVDHPQPIVRFEAAAAIASLAPQDGYAGSSRVRRTLAEMRALGDMPSVLLLATRPGIIVEQEGLLNRLGYQVQVVGSGAELIKSLNKGGDLQWILAKTEIADMSAIELVDRVRRNPRGRNLPILFFGHPAPGLESIRWSTNDGAAPAMMIDRPASIEAFDALERSLQGYQRLPDMTAIDRDRFRSIATDALANLAGLR